MTAAVLLIVIAGLAWLLVLLLDRRCVRCGQRLSRWPIQANLDAPLCSDCERRSVLYLDRHHR